jgi:short-subunit dehydrogenase
MKQSLQGAVVVITGASAGIGEAAAMQFAALGAKLVLAARGADALNRLRDKLAAQGAQALAVPTDMGDDAACARLVERAVEAFGGLDVLVNNAGAHARGLFQTQPAEAFSQMIDVNLRGPIVLTRLALPYLLASSRGAVVNVASLAGRVPVPGSAVYSATKFGLRAFSRALAEEHRGQLKVAIVSPGPVSTGFILDDLASTSDLTLSQPMRTAAQIAALIVAAAQDGVLERAEPSLSGALTTLGYLWPGLSRALRPLMERRGRRVRAKLERDARR